MRKKQENVNRNVNVKRSLNLMLLQNEQFVSTKDAMFILGIKVKPRSVNTNRKVKSKLTDPLVIESDTRSVNY